MNHQTDVRLVYPHTKGVGSRDHAQIADTEVLLNLALVIGAKARMIPFSGDALLFQELRHALGAVAGCTIDDRPRHALARKLSLDRIEDIGHLGCPLRWSHLEAQVRPRCAAVDQSQLGP